MKLQLNLIHRPEAAPEYLVKAYEDKGIETSSVAKNESLEIFEFQQDLAHQLGLKTTIAVTYSVLFDDNVINKVKRYHKEYGDEIGLTFLGLVCPQFKEQFKTDEISYWTFSFEDKKRIADTLFAKFKEVFGFYPSSIGSYYMDTESLQYIKSKYPSIKTAVATCFEEGCKIYHGTNNSWYTFMEGGPWAAWIPSKANVHCPASDENDDFGIVAVPHLTRDLIMPVESRGDFFGAHPQNVLRSMAYEGKECPYFYNMTDQWLLQGEHNGGYSYYMMFVAPNWLSKTGRWEATHDILKQSYIDALEYMAKLKNDGFLEDMTMTEYAEWFRENKDYKKPTVSIWNDILYGSGKQVFWYLDSHFRILVDPCQGGAIVDIRPYAAKLVRPVGPDTEYLANATYPYIINSQYRAGYFTHYMGEGSIYSCKVGYNGEDVDLCTCRSKCHHEENHDKNIMSLDPVTIDFKDGTTIDLITRLKFTRNGCIYIEREIVNSSNENAEFTIREYFNGAYGTTEYSENLKGTTLILTGEQDESKIDYEYKCKSEICENPLEATAIVPQIDTKISLVPQTKFNSGKIREGFLFSPIFSLEMSAKIKAGERTEVCLKVEKAK